MSRLERSARASGHDWGEPDSRGHMACLNSANCAVQVRFLGTGFHWRDAAGNWHPYVRGDMPRCAFTAQGSPLVTR